MCLIAFSWDPGGDMPLLLLANRDEFYDRPTAVADWWPGHDGIWAGRDLQAGGTWLGLTRNGRFAALTNFRNGVPQHAQAPSRGGLVAGFLESDVSPEHYSRQLMPRAHQYNGFNLVVGDIYGVTGPASVWYCGNQAGAEARSLPAGLYGLSNAVLDTPWPKLQRLKARLAGLDSDHRELVQVCMGFLSDPTRADEAELPMTGISREWELDLSSIFIVGPDYGTRAQTVVQAYADGTLEATERSFNGANQARALQPDAVRCMRCAVAPGPELSPEP
ncbi:NRDE family protein [Zobellella maritima]|uniref:NRDE family protein n=1 Tax=Zobellella maritima TaxID=2059725 RepID=UPI000E3092CB|nr:NRDE family protein [Zobellella maritima]